MRAPYEQAKEDARVALWRDMQCEDYRRVKIAFDHAEKYFVGVLAKYFEANPTQLWTGKNVSAVIRAEVARAALGESDG